MKTLEELKAEYIELNQLFVVCEEIFNGVKVITEIEWSSVWAFEIFKVEFNVDPSIPFADEKMRDFEIFNNYRQTPLPFAVKTNKFLKHLNNRLNVFNKEIHEFNKEDMHNYRNLHSIKTFEMMSKFDADLAEKKRIVRVEL